MIKISGTLYSTNFQTEIWKKLFEKYDSIGVNKYEVMDKYTKLREEVATKTNLSGLALEMKVYKTLEDHFVDLLEAEK